MKVLALSASPRKSGNSDVLCDQFLKGAMEEGHETDKIRLQEKNISPCVACYGCMDSHICLKNDDMEEIQQRMVDADVIVLATPVYFYCMDAQMIYGTGTWDKGDVYKHPALQQAYKMGKEV